METYFGRSNDSRANPTWLRQKGFETQRIAPELQAKLQKIGVENSTATKVRAELIKLAAETSYTIAYLEDLFRRYSGYQTLG